MKRIKAIIVALSVASAVSPGLIRAQNNPPTPPGNQQGGWHMGMSTEERVNRLSQELNLTPDQKSKVQAILDEMHQDIETSVKEAKTNADTQLQGVLTAEQYQKFQSMWEQHRQHFGHHMGGGGEPNANGSQNTGQ